MINKALVVTAILLALSAPVFIIIASETSVQEAEEYNSQIADEYTATVRVGNNTYYLVDYELNGNLLHINKYYYIRTGRINLGIPSVINGDFILTYETGQVKDIR